MTSTDTILEAVAKLNDHRREDQELYQIEEKERENKEAAIASMKQDIDRADVDSSEKPKMVKRVRELEQDQIRSESSRRRARLDRRLKIDQLERKIATDREKLRAGFASRQPSQRPRYADPDRAGRAGQRWHAGRLASYFQNAERDRQIRTVIQCHRLRSGWRGKENRGGRSRRSRPGDRKKGGARIHPRACDWY